MRHDICTEGFNLRLRPVRMADAAFIVWLRNLDHVKGKVGGTSADVAAQEYWLRSYFEREGDYYFMVETLGGIPLGTHGIYDVHGTSGETGRYIMRPEVMAGVPASVLAMDLAFGRLGLTELRSASVATNRAVHSLHRKTGFKQVGVLREAQVIEGRPVDLVQFLLQAEDWLKVRDHQLPLATLAGNQVLEWEQTLLGGNPSTRPGETILSSFGVLLTKVFGGGLEEWMSLGDAGGLEVLESCGSRFLLREGMELLPVLSSCLV